MFKSDPKTKSRSLHRRIKNPERLGRANAVKAIDISQFTNVEPWGQRFHSLQRCQLLIPRIGKSRLEKACSSLYYWLPYVNLVCENGKKTWGRKRVCLNTNMFHNFYTTCMLGGKSVYRKGGLLDGRVICMIAQGKTGRREDCNSIRGAVRWKNLVSY